MAEHGHVLPATEEVERARELFGLGPVSTRREVIIAWREAARLAHPDLASPDSAKMAERLMQRINESKQILLNALPPEPEPAAPDVFAEVGLYDPLWPPPGQPTAGFDGSSLDDYEPPKGALARIEQPQSPLPPEPKAATPLVANVNGHRPSACIHVPAEPDQVLPPVPPSPPRPHRPHPPGSERNAATPGPPGAQTTRPSASGTANESTADPTPREGPPTTTNAGGRTVDRSVQRPARPPSGPAHTDGPGHTPHRRGRHRQTPVAPRTKLRPTESDKTPPLVVAFIWIGIGVAVLVAALALWASRDHTSSVQSGLGRPAGVICSSASRPDQSGQPRDEHVEDGLGLESTSSVESLLCPRDQSVGGVD